MLLYPYQLSNFLFYNDGIIFCDVIQIKNLKEYPVILFSPLGLLHVSVKITNPFWYTKPIRNLRELMPIFHINRPKFNQITIILAETF